MTKVLKIGIMPKEEYRKRTIAIAKGEYNPKSGEPKVWFESIKSLAQVLSEENRELLDKIIENKPRSLKELEFLTGRKSSNLSRTLKTMQVYGIVTLKKEKKTVRPIVKANKFKIQIDPELQFTHS
ncbi:MAG: transcriptional regulator [Thermodesulfobacteriota bacterium]|nr:transcriptional regulator [Thermodesulfobacteriota bacterium]